MQQETHTTQKISGWAFWAIISALLWSALFSIGCGRSHDHPFAPKEHEHPHEHDPVFVEIPVFVVCDTVDLEVEFTLIKDQSAPNVYAIFRNGVEVDRIVISETAPAPTEVKFLYRFDRFVIGQETISIQKVLGSRAETIGSALVKIECSP